MPVTYWQSYIKQAGGVIVLEFKILRIRSGLKQAELAKLANVSQSMISAYERGEAMPGMSVLSRLAIALGISVDEVISSLTPSSPGGDAA
ncbi:MAG: helix-turn-helix transcriptional regulator [Bacillota bacterium]|nr:helix-turn-helix transcriptional regulator [Bacillota bacterium]